jgi:hypothetical protein
MLADVTVLALHEIVIWHHHSRQHELTFTVQPIHLSSNNDRPTSQHLNLHL